jgi:hypothetical protein
VTVYLELTREFNAGATRAVICTQAAVLHRLAIASKDGDWILREDPAMLDHVLGVLARHGARYRFGAPLDVRWMSADGARTSSSHERACASARTSSRGLRAWPLPSSHACGASRRAAIRPPPTRASWRR